FEFAITKPEIKIGRNPGTSDLVLPSKQVSGTHALLKDIGSGFMLLDLNSTNGTFIGEEKVSEKFLKDTDQFKIGNFVLKIVDAEDEDSEAYNESPIGSTVLLRSASFFTSLYEPPGGARQLELEAKLQKKIKTLEMLYAFGKTLSSV